MEFRPSRLRRGELVAVGAAVALLVLVFLVPWYGVSARAGGNARGAATSIDGWDGLTHIRWLVLVTIAVAIALAVLQGACRAPALPVSFSMIATVLGALTSVGLIYRVLISAPGPGDPKPGAYLALVSALGLTYGAFCSLREEERPDPAQTAAVPIVRLARRP